MASKISDETAHAWAQVVDRIHVLERLPGLDDATPKQENLERRWLRARAAGLPLSFKAKVIPIDDFLELEGGPDGSSGPKVNKKIRSALLALEALACESMEGPPKPVLSWLKKLDPPRWSPIPRGEVPHPAVPWSIYEHNQETAAKAGFALLDQEDDLPVRSWLASKVENDEDPWCHPRSLQVVPEYLGGHFAVLDSVWGRLEDPALRNELLKWTVYNTSRDYADLPRGWMFTAFLGTEQPACLAQTFLERTWKDKRAVPMLDLMARRAEQHRARAYWSYRLHHHQPYCAPFIRSLKHFLLTDSDPFQGGQRFSWLGWMDGVKSERITGGAIHLLRQLVVWDVLKGGGNRPWLVKGARRLFWLLVDDYPERHRLPAGYQVPANPGESEDLDDLMMAVVRLLERLDDKATMESVFSPDLLTRSGEEQTDWMAAHFRRPFIRWWISTRSPLDALKGLDWSTRDHVLSALDPASLYSVFSAGDEDARGAASTLLMNDGYESSSYARRIGEWTVGQIGRKEKLEWLEDPEHPGHPDEDIDLLMMCCPDLLLEQAEAIAAEQPEQRTWLLDALLLFARQEGPRADRARALARRFALDLGKAESEG